MRMVSFVVDERRAGRFGVSMPHYPEACKAKERCSHWAGLSGKGLFMKRRAKILDLLIVAVA